MLALVAVTLVVLDPPRPERPPGRTPSPYADRYLPRIHLASALLVVPQFVVWTFALVWLVDDRGWTPAAAGSLVAVAQVAGAFGRIAAGQLSDAVRSRLRPLRWVAVVAAAVMALLGLATGAGVGVAVPLVVVAAVVTVAYNGLAFTAVAERAGPFWSGRAMGLQNTGQYLVATAGPAARRPRRHPRRLRLDLRPRRPVRPRCVRARAGAGRAAARVVQSRRLTGDWTSRTARICPVSRPSAQGA